MFSETIIYQILSWVFPSIRMWPDRLFAFMVEVYAESLALIGLQNSRWYVYGSPLAALGKLWALISQKKESAIPCEERHRRIGNGP